MDRELYFISMAAEMLGMHPQTLRKYERLGLIQPSRTIGSMRLYSREELERLRLIKHLVDEAGINLAGVQRLLTIAEVMQRIRPLMEESALSTGSGRRQLLNEIPDLSDKLLVAFQTRRELLEAAGFIGIRVIGATDSKETLALREFCYKHKVPHTFEDIEVLPKPAQKPTPPYWVAATSPPAIQWAAERGHPILMDPHSAHKDIAAKREFYRKELEARGVIARAQSRKGLAEEQPRAYKDVDLVVDTVHRAGLSKKVARMRPIGVIKG